MENLKVTVRFYASLRERLGVKKVNLQLEEGSSFTSATEKLAETLGNKADVIFDKLKIKDSVMVSVNNNLVKPSDLTELKLKDGDVIDIMPLPSGG